MSKRVVVIIIVFFLALFVIGLFLLFSQKPPTPTETTTSSIPAVNPTPTDAPAHTLLFFSPSPLSLTNSSGSVSIDINANGDNISAIQLELQYDPKILTNVDIVPGTYLQNPVVLLKKISPQTGQISFALGLTTNATNLPTTGTVAKLTFQTLPSASGQTQVSFLPNTLVTATGIENSILKSTTPLTIILPR